MGVNNVLYDRPNLDQHFGRAKALYVDGTLPAAGASSAYEGRLPIHNAIGDCWAELINGTLPPGGTVSVDNTTHEVVVKWPAYQLSPVSITNGDFESGPVGWNLGPGWTIPASPSFAYSGTRSAQYDGHGIASIESDPYPVIPGTQTSVQAQIQQGGSSKGHVVARTLLIWTDAAGHALTIPGIQDPGADLWVAGNLVRSGSNGEWHASGTPLVTVPAGVYWAKAAISANRKHENKSLWADAVTWNFQGNAIGTDKVGPVAITLRVHDAGGRVADWSGVVLVNYLAGMLGYWKCDETSGTVLHDSSANGRDGVIVAGAGVVLGAAPLRAGSSGSLGTTALVNTAAHIDISNTVQVSGGAVPQVFTLELIARVDGAVGSDCGVIAAMLVGSLNQQGAPCIQDRSSVWGADASKFEGGTLTSTVVPSTTAHILLVFDHARTAYSNEPIRLYVNGVLMDDAPDNNSGSGLTLYLLGSNFDASYYGVIGRVSDVALYSAAATDAQALAMAARYGFA